MVNNKQINLNNFTSGQVLDTYCPLTLTLTTSAYYTSKQIWRISYDFGDGYVESVDYKPILDFSSTLPYTDTGDCRNYPVTHTINFDNEYSKIYNLNVKVYTVGDPAPYDINFTINTRLPELSEIFSSPNYDNIKLVGSRMFGLDNRLLYWFESQSPAHLFPVLIDGLK